MNQPIEAKEKKMVIYDHDVPVSEKEWIEFKERFDKIYKGEGKKSHLGPFFKIVSHIRLRLNLLEEQRQDAEKSKQEAHQAIQNAKSYTDMVKSQDEQIRRLHVEIEVNRKIISTLRTIITDSIRGESNA